MKKIILAVFILIIIQSIILPKQKKTKNFIKAPIIKASLFKNGLAIVTRQVKISASQKTLIIKDAPKPVHGTFWTDYKGKIEFVFDKIKTKEVKGNILSTKDIFEKIIGKRVKLFLNNNQSITGVIDKSNRNIANYIVLKTKGKFEFIQTSRVFRFSLIDKKVKIKNLKKIEKKTKFINVIKIKLKSLSKTRKITFSYLTRGLTWAPSYKLNFINNKKADLSLKAIIKNELLDVKNAQINLISGFPAIKFNNVLSPLAHDQSINNFFTQLANRDNSYRYRREVITQNVAFNQPPGFITANVTDRSDLSTSDFDIHFQNIGKTTILKDQAKSISIDQRQTSIEKILEWNIPNNRDYRGRLLSSYNSKNREKVIGTVWDSVIIKNPFNFPMTTAPITIYNKDRFFSQNISYWISPKQKNSIKITKALNIQVSHVESELAGKRKKMSFSFSSDDYQESTVEAVIKIRNNRNRKQKILIKRVFVGKIISADYKPVKRLLPEGVFSVNEKNELSWILNIDAGDAIEIKYKYKYYVDL